ncbi:hypothetical protein ACIHEJ_25200 [Streptomyces sp. NPDC052301]|uniref:hypothetical protein n=1 Tax=Streptomyces sp. NPDC052301 TaxID=3365687 RepID=UPI0037D66B55
MGQHTTDEVYDRLTEVKQQLEKNVTTAHFDDKMAELKTAIEKGGKGAEEKKKEAPKTIWDIIKSLPLVKQALDLFQQLKDLFNGANLIGQMALIGTVATGALAFYRKIRETITGTIGKIKGILATLKNATLKVTGRFLGERKYFGRNDQGKFRLRPERTSDEIRRAVREGNRRARRGGRGGGASADSGAGDARDLGQALGRVNSQVEAFDRLKSKLPSASKMKRTAGAATKLSGALEKVTERLRPAELDELTAATDRLNQKMSAFDHEKLPKPRTLKDISKAAKELHDNADKVREMFQNLATASTHAADAIS